MKICFKCGAAKPLSEFYEHKMMADGHLNKCKACTKTDVKVRRKVNPAVQEYDRKRGNRQNAEDLRKYRAENPKKYKAHQAVHRAVKNGTMIKLDQCELCSSGFGIEGHHDDYNKPLEVRWLCSKCHSLWHVDHGEALNG
jgi:ribosomal protein S27AE